MPEYPFETYGSVGAVGADANPFICGGSSHGPNPVAGECYTFEDGAWKNVFNMTGPRQYAALLEVDRDGTKKVRWFIRCFVLHSVDTALESSPAAPVQHWQVSS